jgi:ketosteroid isomerase-like protein
MRAAIREVLVGLIAAQTRMACRVERCVTAGDIAVLYADFTGEQRDAAGQATALDSRAIEVLRREADGAWRLNVGDPNGRG